MNSKKMAILALSSCMALSVGAAIGVGAEEFVSVKADTAKYFVAAENYTASVTQRQPATVNLTESAGQYFVKAVITQINDKPVPSEHYEFYELVASVNGESVNLNYNLGTHTFSGVITTGNQSELTLTLLGSEDKLTLDVTLENLYLGEDNDFTLSNVTLPVHGETLDIGIDNLSGDYILLVDLGMVRPADKLTINANGKSLLENGEYYSAYSGQITLKESKSIQITTDSTAPLTATISLTPVITYDELPASVTLNMYETVTYKYTATEETGYYSLNVSSTDEKAEISIFFKNAPEDFEGISVTQNNFPLYMVKDTEYYFDLTLVNATENATNATFATKIEAWKTPTIMAETNTPVPATPVGTENVTVGMNVESGNYSFTLLDVPFDYYMQGTTVTAYIENMDPVVLTPSNNYSAELQLSSANSSVYLVTDGGNITIVTLSVSKVAEKHYINLNEAAQISVPAATTEEEVLIPGSSVYYISLKEEESMGFYGVTLAGLNSSDITLNVLGLPAVFKGNKVGGFKVTFGLDEIALEFLNEGSEEATFTATVNKLEGTYDLTLGNNSNIQLNQGTTVYYLEGLAMGDYKLELSADTAVYVDGIALTVNNGSATFNVSAAQDDRGFVAVMFESAESKKIDVTVTPLNVITFNTALSITTVGDYYRTAYYINLKAGTYAIMLDTPENLYAEVTANNLPCVSYGGKSGLLKVETDGYVVLRFTGYTYGAENTFKAIITDIAGTMVMGAEADITLPVSEFGKVYELTGIIPGPYTITVVEGVEVYVDGALVENASFYVYDVSCSVMFVNTTKEELTFKTKVTPANLLTLNENTVTIEAWTYSKTYFIELTEGEYGIDLTLPEGISIEVTIDNKTVVAYGEISGTFTVSAAGYVQINFNTQSNEEVTFTVEVYEA